MKKRNVAFVTASAMIAALYVVLNVVFGAFGSMAIQLRIAEALTILPVFTPAAIPGLFVGCMVGNFLVGNILPDVIFGSLATLLGAVGSYFIGKKKPLLAPIAPTISNALIIPLILKFGYGEPFPISYMMLTVGLGELISAGVFGIALFFALKPIQNKIFH